MSVYDWQECEGVRWRLSPNVRGFAVLGGDLCGDYCEVYLVGADGDFRDCTGIPDAFQVIFDGRKKMHTVSSISIVMPANGRKVCLKINKELWQCVA